MSEGNVTRLPTAPDSYFTVRKSGKAWAVVLVTPAGKRHELRTALARCPDRDAAIAYARDAAEQMQRPLKVKGVAP